MKTKVMIIMPVVAFRFLFFFFFSSLTAVLCIWELLSKISQELQNLGYAALFSCTAVVHASDSMTALM